MSRFTPKLSLCLVLLFCVGLPLASAQDRPVDAQRILETGYAPDTILVQFKPDAAKSVVDAITRSMDMERVSYFEQIDVGVYQIPTNRVMHTVDALSACPEVAFAEPNYIRRTLFVPNDPRYSEQWGFPKINAPAAWDITMGSSDVIVAVIDTGIDQDHPDLVNQRWINTDEIANNGVDDDGNGYTDDRFGYDFFGNALFGIIPPGENAEDSDPEDDNGHGSHTAGTVAAATDNGIGVAGTASGCRVMVVRALGTILGMGYSSDIIKAMFYATDNGAHVISMSLGSTTYSTAELTAAVYAENHDVLVVAAAGNGGNTQMNYPAGYPTVMAVSATTSTDGLASFSSRGANIDVGAPGQGILSCSLSGGYASHQGTSMACPHVAGLCGLVRSQFPTATAAQTRQMVRNGAHDLGATGWDPNFGDGRIDALGALTTAVPDPDQVALFQPGDGGTLNSGGTAFGFGWSRVASAASYGVQFQTPSGGTITILNLPYNFFYPNQSAWGSIPPGNYKWRAGALDGNGQIISVSDWWDFIK